MNSTYKILLAEDNHLNQKLFRRMLQNTTYTVTMVASGEDALKQIKQASFGLLFFDYHMPGINGIETYMQIKEILEQECPPAYLVTGNQHEEEFKMAELAGFVDVLIKPLSKATLIPLVEAASKHKK